MDLTVSLSLGHNYVTPQNVNNEKLERRKYT